MSRTLPELPDQHPDRVFWRLLDWHLASGTRPANRPDALGGRWTNDEFGMACGGLDEKTIRLWRNGNHIPNDLPTIERALFGDGQSYLVWRNELRQAYDAAKRDRNATSAARLINVDSTLQQGNELNDEGTGDSSSVSEPAFPSYDESWNILGSSCIIPVVELRLHRPRLGNDGARFYLDATLVAGTAEYEYADRSIYLGIKHAFLSIETRGCQPSQSSMLGERTGADHFKRVPGGVEITGPCDDLGHLSGDVLNGEYITIMEPTAGNEQSVAVSINTYRRSFSMVASNRKGGAPRRRPEDTNKDAIINALIGKEIGTDKMGRVLLASAKIRRRSKR